VESDSERAFVADGLGHPLIPAGRKVCNDFALEAPGHIVIITGSNMAGKSSFLRAVGVNLCLAYAGGPVNAGRLACLPLRVFTSIRVSDSVTDGFSYFYAEVRRLRALLDALDEDDERPVCFLIDEIFRGTNNRERLIGSRAYIRALAGRRGLGVIATHDLELVRLADALPGLRNQHFRDAVIDGRMVFDYRLRPGPCPTTNALKIMHMEGLPVEPDAIPAPGD
jgi:DNA mismatch repair ATPase MutS